MLLGTRQQGVFETCILQPMLNLVAHSDNVLLEFAPDSYEITEHQGLLRVYLAAEADKECMKIRSGTTPVPKEWRCNSRKSLQRASPARRAAGTSFGLCRCGASLLAAKRAGSRSLEVVLLGCHEAPIEACLRIHGKTFGPQDQRAAALRHLAGSSS